MGLFHPSGYYDWKWYWVVENFCLFRFGIDFYLAMRLKMICSISEVFIAHCQFQFIQSKLNKVSTGFTTVFGSFSVVQDPLTLIDVIVQNVNYTVVVTVLVSPVFSVMYVYEALNVNRMKVCYGNLMSRL